MNPPDTPQAAIQFAQKITANQQALIAAAQRCTAANAQVQRVLGGYANLVTSMQRDILTALTEQAASFQSMADLATVFIVQDSPHVPGGGKDQ